MYGFVMGTDGEDDADPEGGAPDALAPEDGPWTDSAPEEYPPEIATAPDTAPDTDADILPTAAAPVPDRAQPDAPGGLDRFRKKVKPRSGGAAWQEDGRPELASIVGDDVRPDHGGAGRRHGGRETAKNRQRPDPRPLKRSSSHLGAAEPVDHALPNMESIAYCIIGMNLPSPNLRHANVI